MHRTKPRPLPAGAVAVSDDYGALKVGDELFGLGDTLLVFSTLSQETLQGVLVVLTDKEAVLRAATGQRFSFQLPLLQAGRVAVSRAAPKNQQ